MFGLVLGNCLHKAALTTCSVLALGLAATSFAAPRQMENLSRGLVASNVGKGMLVSWRLLGSDDPKTEFNLYRDGEKIASIGATEGTNYLDKDGSATSKYEVAAVIGGTEGKKAGLSLVYDKTVSNNGRSFPYKTIKLSVPANQIMPDDGDVATYTPNDMSAGDLDGDGEYELVVKWEPSNAHDNSHANPSKNQDYTGTTIIDAYKMDGTRLWRIDLGKNIRSGAHYTQFQVFDYDGDGKAEMIVKTADGTVDGKGNVIGDGSKDYRTTAGTILSGPEYLTVFRGEDGAAITTVDYVPSRSIRKAASDLSDGWGDGYGNRSERYIAATAYLDGVHPSAIFIRGYYSASYVVAWDFDGKELKQRWFHKSEVQGQGLFEQGNHNIATGDIDGDGYDEIVFGSAALNHDGSLRYTTMLGHGDAGHLSDLDPDLPGLEFFDVHEHTDVKYSDEVRGPDGKILWGSAQSGKDNGRGMAADIDSTHRGFEVWSNASGGMHDIKGKLIGSPAVSTNFRIYFDGDLQDELLDGAFVTKFNSSAMKSEDYFDGAAALGASGCNGSKNTPNLVADLFGDWREELVVRSSTDPSSVYIVSTPVTSPHRVYTLMHDAVYRTAIAWQNTAYNQPPHLGYFLPDAVKNLKAPDIQVVGEILEPIPDESDNYPVIKDGKSVLDASTPVEGVGNTENSNAGFEENGYFNFENSISSYGVWEIFSPTDAKTTLTIRFTNGGTGSRNMALSVNGKSAGSISFPSTNADWTKYDEVTVDVALKAGKNVIRFTSMVSDGGPNFDMFTFAMDGVEIYANQKVPEADLPLPDSSATSDTSKVTDSSTVDIGDSTIHCAPVPFALGLNTYNPQTGVLRTNRSGWAQVVIFDMRGHVVGSVSKKVNAGESVVSIDREMLPQGRFLVKVQLDDKVISKGAFLNK